MYRIDEKTALLDSVRNITFNLENPPIDNPGALFFMPGGLHALANAVRQDELTWMPPPLSPNAKRLDIGLITCMFDWFGVSLVNYLRIVGLVEIMNINGWKTNNLTDKTIARQVKVHCTDYVKSVIPEIYKWRNKVAAHFAITDPFADDNLSTLEFSLMGGIAYMRPYYEVGGFQLVIDTESSQLERWSLTETYEMLTPRFWPELGIEPFPEKINPDF